MQSDRIVRAASSAWVERLEPRRLLAGDQEILFDFGDAPDGVSSAAPYKYQTIFGGAGGTPAFHILLADAPRLGASVDAEPGGQPDLAAKGDDDNLAFPGIQDDEDGVSVGGTRLDSVAPAPGTIVPVDVRNGGTVGGLVSAWFDFNRNGVWDAPDQVAADVPVGAGATVSIPVAVPAGIPLGTTVYSRFRISTAAALGPGAPAPDGEVEDYAVRIGSDNMPPIPLSATLNFETQQSVTIVFDEPLNPGSVAPADLLASNLDDGSMPVPLSVSGGGAVWTWVFNNPGTSVSDGDYSFTLPAGAVRDPAGNASAMPINLSGPGVYFLGGDANRDGKVNTRDFNVLAGNFGMSGKTFSQGNFNYAGTVDSTDFGILVGRYGKAGIGPGAQPQSPFAAGLGDSDDALLVVDAHLTEG